jgi:hypothetical protein
VKTHPLRHQVIETPPITPLVIEHRLHRLVCPYCSTSTCAPLPADVEVSRYGPWLSSLIALQSAAFPLSISKSQALLQQVLGVEHPRASIVRRLQRVSAALEQPITAAHRALQQQPVVDVDATGAPTCKRGWLWVAMSPVVTVFLQGLSRSAAAATELLGHGFGGIVVSDRYSEPSCWSCSTIASRSGWRL